MARKQKKRSREEAAAHTSTEQPASNKVVKHSHERRNKRRRIEIAPTASKRHKPQSTPAASAVGENAPTYFNSPGWKRHVLYQLFPTICNLASYLTSDTVSVSYSSILMADDAASYVELLSDTLVVPFVSFSRPAVQSFTPPGVASERLRALLLRAVDRTLYKPVTRPASASSSLSRSAAFPPVTTPLPLSASFSTLPSVLSLGFRLARGDSDSALVDRPSVESVDINSMSSHIQQSREWQLLTERVGEAVMAHLLLQCFCFAPLPNLCFMQLTGPPLPDAMKAAKEMQPKMAKGVGAEMESRDKQPSLKRAASDITSQHTPVKRTCTDPASATISAGLAPPSRSSSATPAAAAAVGPAPSHLLQRVIPQSAILYQQSSRWQVGLPPNRQLNRGNTATFLLWQRDVAC